MPKLELDKKIEFKVDESIIPKVKALAVIHRMTADAYFRRLIDLKVGLNTRETREDFEVVEIVSDSVFDLIQHISMSSQHPLREKALSVLATGILPESAVKPKPSVAKKKKTREEKKAEKEAAKLAKEEPKSEDELLKILDDLE
jgi:hypothetical protein